MTSSWTTEREQILTDHWYRGFSSSAIAEILGVTRNTIIGKVGRLKLSRDPDIPRTSVKSHKPQRNDRIVIKRPVFVARVVKQQSTPELKPLMLSWNEVGHGCLFACNEAQDAGSHLFCGHPRKTGTRFCPVHCGVTYVAPRARRI